MAEVIRLGERETGTYPFAALRDRTYGESERAMTAGVAAHLGPMFNRLGRRWGQPAEAIPAEDPGSSAVSAVARMIGTADNPRAFAQALWETISPFIAAERLEILVPGTSPEQWYRLSEHSGGALWSDPELIVSRTRLDVPGLFGVNDSVLMADIGPNATVMPPPVRSLAGCGSPPAAAPPARC